MIVAGLHFIWLVLILYIYLQHYSYFIIYHKKQSRSINFSIILSVYCDILVIAVKKKKQKYIFLDVFLK